MIKQGMARSGRRQGMTLGEILVGLLLTLVLITLLWTLFLNYRQMDQNQEFSDERERLLHRLHSQLRQDIRGATLLHHEESRFVLQRARLDAERNLETEEIRWSIEAGVIQRERQGERTLFSLGETQQERGSIGFELNPVHENIRLRLHWKDSRQSAIWLDEQYPSRPGGEESSQP